MKKKLLSLLFLVATLALTGCGYKKPEVHSMLGMNIKSITTVCGTDCSMDTIDTSSTSDHGMITYYYTDVAGDKGISDAKTYYNYLKSEKHCIKIDDFDEKKGNYSAYFQLNEKQVKSGFLMKVSFTKNSYTVYIEDNIFMSEEYRFKDRIKDIINGDVDYDKLRKAEKQGWIDRADTGFQLFLILFFLGFFIVMLIKYFL